MERDYNAEIDEQTKLIAELEASFPPYYKDLGRWHKDNGPLEAHYVRVRDAYWKRRMLIEKRDGASEEELRVTASYY